MTLSLVTPRAILKYACRIPALFFYILMVAASLLFATAFTVSLLEQICIAILFFTALFSLGLIGRLISSYFLNRKVLFAGAKWSVGKNESFYRIDTPLTTIVIDRRNIVSEQRFGQLEVIELKKKSRLSVPAPLVDALRALPADPDDPSSEGMT